MQYSSFFNDLQKDCAEEGIVEKALNVELPFQEDSHFKQFEIKFRNKKSSEDVKKVLLSLTKDSLLLDLIPIAFNKELEREIQTFSLFVEKANSFNIIWDFILASFRFFGKPEGLH